MKRRYKLLLIILFGMIITFFINISNKDEKINLVAIGDGLALGYVDIGIQGISFNDYLKDSLDAKNNLKSYNNEFCIYNLSISSLNNLLNSNTLGNKTKNPIKQTINQADVLTIAMGMDELYYYTSFASIDIETNVNNYLNIYDKILKNIRNFYSNNIVIIGLYPIADMSKSIIIDINKKLNKMALQYDAKFIDILGYSLKNEYYLNENTYYLNYKAHKEIAKNISKLINI